jgi:hypothetical protein
VVSQTFSPLLGARTGKEKGAATRGWRGARVSKGSNGEYKEEALARGGAVHAGDVGVEKGSRSKPELRKTTRKGSLSRCVADELIREQIGPRRRCPAFSKILPNS